MPTLKRFAPDSWGQMIEDKPGTVWDEQPGEFYVRVSDVKAKLLALPRHYAHWNGAALGWIKAAELLDLLSEMEPHG